MALLQGAVMVTVVSARDIAAADPGGTSDPYVTVKLNEHKHKTATKKNAKGSAEWNEKYEWHKARPQPAGSDFKVLVCCLSGTRAPGGPRAAQAPKGAAASPPEGGRPAAFARQGWERAARPCRGGGGGDGAARAYLP